MIQKSQGDSKGPKETGRRKGPEDKQMLFSLLQISKHSVLSKDARVTD